MSLSLTCIMCILLALEGLFLLEYVYESACDLCSSEKCTNLRWSAHHALASLLPHRTSQLNAKYLKSAASPPPPEVRHTCAPTPAHVPQS